MEKLSQFLGNDSFKYLLYIFLGAVIIVLINYFLYRTQKFRRYTFLKQTNQLLMLTDYKPDSLHLYFGDKEIKNVYVTRIALWNSGNMAIEYADAEVSISIENEEESSILECSVDYKKVGTKELKRDSEGRYRLIFDNFVEKEGIILQVVHTGDANNLSLDFQINKGKRTIEIDKNNHILSVNGEKIWIRRIWAKIVSKLGFRPEAYKTIIIMHELFFSIIYALLYYLFDGPIDNFLDRLFIYRTIDVLRAMCFFALLDILLLIIDILLLQKIPDGLNERLWL